MSSDQRCGDMGNPFVDFWKQRRTPNVQTMLREYRNTVFACANLNASSFASVPLRLYTARSSAIGKPKCEHRNISAKQLTWLHSNKGLVPRLARADMIVEVTSHPILDLLQSVNEVLDGYVLMELTDLYQEINGSAYWWIPPGPLGIRTDIWILPPQYVTPLRDPTKIISGYEYRPGGAFSAATKILPPDEVISFRFPNLEDPYCDGYSPLRGAYESVLMANEQRSYQLSLMANQARPDWLLSPTEFVGEQAAARAEERLRKRLRRNPGGLMVLSDNYKPVALQFAPRDLQMTALAGLNKIDIANAYGVPMSLLETKDVNKANAEAGHYQHRLNAILPRCRRTEDRLNAKFCPMFDASLFLAFDNPVPEDIDQQISVEKSDMEHGVRTINEVRIGRNLAPVEWGDKPWISTQLTQYGPDMDQLGTSQPLPNTNLPTKQSSTVRLDALMSILVGHATGMLATNQARQQLIKLYNLPPTAVQAILVRPAYTIPSRPMLLQQCAHNNGKHIGHTRKLPTGDTIEKQIRSIFAQQRIEILNAMKQTINMAIKLCKAATDDPPKLIVPSAMLNRSIDLSHWTPLMIKQLVPAIDILWDEGAKDFIVRRNLLNLAFSVQAPMVREAIDASTLRFCAETNATTTAELDVAIAQLRTELAEGIIGPENTVIELTRRVSTIFDRAEQWRAKRIAITESSRALHSGQRMAAKLSGVVKGFKWLVSLDACQECQDIVNEQEADGISIDGKFAQTSYGDIEYPPLHPNCQCTMTEVLIAGE